MITRRNFIAGVAVAAVTDLTQPVPAATVPVDGANHPEDIKFKSHWLLDTDRIYSDDGVFQADGRGEIEIDGIAHRTNIVTFATYGQAIEQIDQPDGTILYRGGPVLGWLSFQPGKLTEAQFRWLAALPEFNPARPYQKGKSVRLHVESKDGSHLVVDGLRRMSLISKICQPSYPDGTDRSYVPVIEIFFDRFINPLDVNETMPGF